MKPPVFVYESPGESYVLVRGYVGGWFRGRGIPAYRSHMHNGWWVRRERADDVLAEMQAGGLWVRYIDGHAPRHVPSAAVDVDDWRAA